MKNLLNSKWIYLINTLPIIILLFLAYGEFSIIKSLLKEESINLWKTFGFSLISLGIINVIYVTYLTLSNKKVSILYNFISIIAHIIFIYMYLFYSGKIIPFSIPRWMISNSLIIYVITFLMPTIAYSLFSLVIHYTPKEKEYNIGKNILYLVLIPFGCYLSSIISDLIPSWLINDYTIHIIIPFYIIATFLFLFFLIRIVLIISSKRSDRWKEYKLVLRILFFILLPLFGLAVNNGDIKNLGFGKGIFGDFSNIWFYIIAVINGVLLCLPNKENKLYRFLLFIGRSITFSYTFYFFIVFLPFLPLSTIAIIVIGLGFLMLTPLVIFTFHINQLFKDFIYLKNYFSKNLISIISILSFLTIPIIITFSYLNHKKVLTETLDYIYNPDYSKRYSIDKKSLEKTIKTIKSHKRKSFEFIFSSKQPYLSTYFKYLVLDNLTLSNEKINKIEAVFFKKELYNYNSGIIRNKNVEITDIKTKSTYDKSQDVWKTWVNFEITNKNKKSRDSEYYTIINLPTSCWISDYYLHIGDRKEMGILAEKKSAMWVFSQIRNYRKDPGILHYTTGNKVKFRIFPFLPKEVKKTGIEFLHKEPMQLTIDGNIINLGNKDQIQKDASFEDENIIYVSKNKKETLKKVKRQPYFHFLIDISEGKENNFDRYNKQIQKIKEDNPKLSKNSKYSFVNTYTNTFPSKIDLEKALKEQKYEGGFYLDRAIKRTLINSYKKNKSSFPIIIVVTDSIQEAILDKDFSDLKITFPENNFFFNINKKAELDAYSLIINPKKQLENNSVSNNRKINHWEMNSRLHSRDLEKDTLIQEEKTIEKQIYTLQNVLDNSVLEYKYDNNKIAYLPNNNEASIILKNKIFNLSENDIKEKKWKSALKMQANWTSQVLNPEKYNKEWLKLIKYSFMSKVMTPLTSYIVVENEAQKAILKKKQKKVLSGNKSLDLGNKTRRMSEPSLIILGLLLALILWIRKRRINC